MASISCLNPNAELARNTAALEMNISGAKGLQEVMKSNLGPKGTLKMLVSGSGDLKVTKDGNVLLHEMQIQHPTASLIAKACTAQNDATGDGTTSTVLLIGELLKQAELYISDGMHPHLITEGFQIAYNALCKFLIEFRKELPIERNLLVEVAQTALRTKLELKLANHITECIVDAILAIRKDEKDFDPDLHMIEIMQMENEMESDTKFIRGLVLDHGGRHPDMPKNLTNVFVLTCNSILAFFYKTAAEREALLQAEREYITRRVLKIIELKKQVCGEKGKEDASFVVINQKGIDPPSLDLLAKNGILALRRAKRRNMERLQLCCGGTAVNSVDDLTPEVLGWAGSVYEYILGEDKYTFIEDCKNPKSVTLLLKGPNKHSVGQIKDAIYDGIRAVFNVLKDGAVVPGAGAFEIAAYCTLKKLADTVKGRLCRSYFSYTKTLAVNAGHDAQEVIVKLVEAYNNNLSSSSTDSIGLDLESGEACILQGVWDNVRVKQASLAAAVTIASNLLEVDEVMRAGLRDLKSGGGGQ
uniref:Uncharacterized protein n=1 Tax=Meloidogyne enterolobii TaxID=390850 RepID=A0A6V7UBC3_MELEN|nr:unnamed protein product [Meloidogyne enterolobii]